MRLQKGSKAILRTRESRSHLCDIHAINLSVSCSCPENFSESEYSNTGLICLAEEIYQDRTA